MQVPDEVQRRGTLQFLTQVIVTSASTPKLVFYAQSTLLEGPAFNKDLNLVLCVSIEQERIFLVNPDEQTVKTFKTKGQVGFAVFEDNEHIIYAAYQGVFRLDISTGEETFLYHLINDPQIRYNDGKKDPKGRLLLGTTGYKCFKEKQNALYSHDGHAAKVLVRGTSISNGIGFYKNYLFFIDTPTRKVGRYIYDEDGNGWIIQCVENGAILLLDGLTGVEKASLQVDGSIKASPAVYNDIMVIGTTGKGTSFVYGIRIK